MRLRISKITGLAILFVFFSFIAVKYAVTKCCYPCPAVVDDMITRIIPAMVGGFVDPIKGWLDRKWAIWLEMRNMKGISSNLAASVQTNLEKHSSNLLQETQKIQKIPNKERNISQNVSEAIYKWNYETEDLFQRYSLQERQVAREIYRFCQDNEDVFSKFSSTKWDIASKEGVQKDFAHLAHIQANILLAFQQMVSVREQTNAFLYK